MVKKCSRVCLNRKIPFVHLHLVYFEKFMMLWCAGIIKIKSTPAYRYYIEFIVINAYDKVRLDRSDRRYLVIAFICLYCYLLFSHIWKPCTQVSSCWIGAIWSGPWYNNCGNAGYNQLQSVLILHRISLALMGLWIPLHPSRWRLLPMCAFLTFLSIAL